MTKVLSGVALEQAATRASHYRSPPNPHEKIAEGTRRTVLALAYKDGYQDCAKAAHADYRALEEDLAALRGKTAELVSASTAARRELQSCQSVIHLHGGFDPAYVEGAQKAIRDLSSVLERLA